MSTRSNTFPYTNARREGRTQPGLIEDRAEVSSTREGWLGSILKPQPKGVVPNRSDLRRRGVRGPGRGPLALRARTTRTARPKCQHGTTLPYPWSTRTAFCRQCADEVTALLARQAAEAEARAAEQAAARGSRRRRTKTEA